MHINATNALHGNFQLRTAKLHVSLPDYD